MTTPQPTGDSEDMALDAFLTNADAELLDHVHAHTNPARTLNTLFDLAEDLDPDSPVDFPRPLHTATTSVQHIHARLQARALYHALYLALALARALARDLDVALKHDLNHDLADTRLLAHDLAHGLALARDLAHDLARVRDLTLVRVRDRALDRALDLDVVLALELVRDRDRDLVRALDLALVLGHDLGNALDLVRVLDLNLYGVRIGRVDALGADLSGLGLTDADLDVLAGVVWDQKTRWPEELRERIASSSEEIEEGVYRVRGGDEHDPHTTTPR